MWKTGALLILLVATASMAQNSKLAPVPAAASGWQWIGGRSAAGATNAVTASMNTQPANVILAASAISGAAQSLMDNVGIPWQSINSQQGPLGYPTQRILMSPVPALTAVFHVFSAVVPSQFPAIVIGAFHAENPVLIQQGGMMNNVLANTMSIGPQQPIQISTPGAIVISVYSGESGGYGAAVPEGYTPVADEPSGGFSVRMAYKIITASTATENPVWHIGFVGTMLTANIVLRADVITPPVEGHAVVIGGGIL